MKRFLAVLIMVVLIAVPAFAGDISMLTVIRDSRGVPADGVITTGYIDAIVLTANSAVTYTTPTDAHYMLFSGNADFYVKIGGTATVPSATTATGAASILNPTLRSVSGATSVSLISGSAAIITIESFK